jgi:chromosome segregation ATPase
MIDINTTKENILQSFSRNVNETFGLLQEVINEIELANKKLLSVTLEYSTVVENTNKLNKETNDSIVSLQRDINSFNKEKEEFNNSVNKFNQTKSLFEKDYSNKVSSRDSISKEIETLSVKLESIKNQIDAKETISKELKSLGEEVVSKSDELNQLNQSIVDIKKDIDRMKLDGKKELQETILDIETRRKTVLPTIEMLNEREKSLNEKEKGIAIIEARYKRLYQEKGVGFKLD